MNTRIALRPRAELFRFTKHSSPSFRQFHSSLSSNMAAPESSKPALHRYADIGINLSDPIFTGLYHGKQSHPSDLQHVIQRARAAGVQKMLVTGSDLTESKNAIRLAEEHPNLCYATIGVHPCSAKSFKKNGDGLLQEIKKLAIEAKENGTGAAFGEIGLDYDRLHYADKELQKEWFQRQLEVAVDVQMPLFLHMRAAAEDFCEIVRPHLQNLPKRGVVHSFTGSHEELSMMLEMGFDIGINGCSLKTEENLDVVKEVPLERLQIETDGPWCEMRPSHAGSKLLKDAPPLPKAVKKEKWSEECMVKGRNEPCAIAQVAWAVAEVKGVPVEEVIEAAWSNSVRMFSLGEKSP